MTKKSVFLYIILYLFSNIAFADTEIVIPEPQIVKLFSSFSEPNKYEFKVGGALYTGSTNSSIGINANIYNNMTDYFAPVLGADIRYHVFNFDNKLSRLTRTFNAESFTYNIKTSNKMDFSAKFGFRIKINKNIAITPYGILGISWNRLYIDNIHFSGALQNQLNDTGLYNGQYTNNINYNNGNGSYNSGNNSEQYKTEQEQYQQQINGYQQQINDLLNQNSDLQNQLNDAKYNNYIFNLENGAIAKQVTGMQVMSIDNFVKYLQDKVESAEGFRLLGDIYYYPVNFLLMNSEYDIKANKDIKSGWFCDPDVAVVDGVQHGNIPIYSYVRIREDKSIEAEIVDKEHIYGAFDDSYIDNNNSNYYIGEISNEKFKSFLEKHATGDKKYIILKTPLGNDPTINNEIKSDIKDDVIVVGSAINTENIKIYVIKTPAEDGNYTIKYVLGEDFEKNYKATSVNNGALNKTDPEINTTKEVYLQSKNRWITKYGAGIEIGINKNFFITTEYRYSRPDAITIISSNTDKTSYEHKIDIHEINIGFGYYFI